MVENIVSQAERFGDPIPDVIKNRPILNEHLEFFEDAFWLLCSCRVSSMGVGSIPLTAILEYGRFMQCGQELTEDLVEYVMAMDNVFVQIQSKKLNKK